MGLEDLFWFGRHKGHPLEDVIEGPMQCTVVIVGMFDGQVLKVDPTLIHFNDFPRG